MQNRVTLLLVLALFCASVRGGPWDLVDEAIENSAFVNISFVVGNSQGRLHTFSRGSLPITQRIGVASASKWVTAATVMMLLEEGIVDLDMKASDYFSFWTSNPNDLRSQVKIR
jgi:CubicO group peptidase (beta-lactamase class C family)